MDLGDQADEAWLLSVQRKLYQWSRTHPEDSYREVWNWITDIRNLRCAWQKIALNKGRRTAGVDGMTVAGIKVVMGMDLFLEQLRGDLKGDRYKPSPSRRKLIPKPRQPGKFRPLGIPTVRDRVVQCAVKNILEPIFEAGFWHVSYGFRPGRGCHGALEHIRMCMRPRSTAEDGRRQRTPYQWVIEGDIKGCFDNIDHHQLMKRVGRVQFRGYAVSTGATSIRGYCGQNERIRNMHWERLETSLHFPFIGERRTVGQLDHQMERKFCSGRVVGECISHDLRAKRRFRRRSRLDMPPRLWKQYKIPN
jgi:retron-type reverse transcriptase